MELILRRAVNIAQKTGLIRSNFVRKVGRKVTRWLLPEEVEIKIGRSKMLVNPKTDGEWYIYGYEGAEKGVRDVIRDSLSKGDCFVDVGAFIGYYSILAREYVGKEGKIIAFEPNPFNYQKLRKNIELNSFTNVVAENMALADKEGSLKLFKGKCPTSHSLVPGTQYTKEDYVTIKAIPFDKYQEEHSVIPKCIKIDVEGAEYYVLKGMERTINTYHPDIILEVHPEHLNNLGLGVEALLTFLEKRGYKLFNVHDMKSMSAEELSRVCRKKRKTAYGGEANVIVFASCKKD